MAVADPCFSGGLISMITTCESGTRAAPNTPCSNRAPTMKASELARPHNAEAAVNPATDIRNTFFCP